MDSKPDFEHIHYSAKKLLEYTFKTIEFCFGANKSKRLFDQLVWYFDLTENLALVFDVKIGPNEYFFLMKRDGEVSSLLYHKTLDDIPPP